MADFKKLLSVLKPLLKELWVLVVGSVVIVSMINLYLLSLPIFLLRYVLIKLAKLTRPELGRIVSPQGNVFSSDLFSGKSPRCSIVVPFLIEGHYSKATVFSMFNRMVNAKDKNSGEELYPQFRQYVETWFGFSFWRNDSNFDLNNHVKFLALGEDNDNQDSAGSTPLVTDKEVTQFIEQLINRQFDPKKSPWEAYFIENYENPAVAQPGPKTLMLFRIHHTLADGYSVLYALTEGLLQSSLDTLKLPTPNYVKRGGWSQFWFNVTIPLRVVYDVGNYAVKGFRKNPWLVYDGNKSWKQYYAKGKPFPIQKIKEVKNELGVSLTSVMLAAISATISRSIRAKQGGKGDIDRAAFFIPLPLPGHPNALENHVTGAQIDLPMENYSDPALRVLECENLLHQQKRSTIPMLLIFLARTLGLHMSAICGELTANRVNISGLTSFPAGSTDITIGDTGNKLLSVELAVGALTGVSGAAFMAISHTEHMQFSVTAESAVFNREEVDGLLTSLHEELELLHRVVVCKKLDAPPSY